MERPTIRKIQTKMGIKLKKNIARKARKSITYLAKTRTNYPTASHV